MYLLSKVILHYSALLSQLYYIAENKILSFPIWLFLTRVYI